MRVIVLFFMMSLGIAVHLRGQTHSLVSELEAKRSAILQQIQESEKLLQTTNLDVSNQLVKLSALSGQIDDRKRYLQRMNSDLTTIDKELRHIEADLEQLETQLTDRKGKYAASMQLMGRSKSIEDKLLFVLSAKSLAQSYRRLRYVNEYATYQRIQGESVTAKQTEIKTKKDELNQTRAGKGRLLREREAEQRRLEAQEKQLKQLVTELQQRRWQLQQEIARKKKEAELLNAQIDNIINAEIEKSQLTASKEEKEEATAAKDDTAAAKDEATADESEEAKTESAATKAEAVTPIGRFVMSKADRQLSGSFLSNRGKLPIPVTGAYAIISRYGQYRVQGLRFVKLENKGIDIQGRPGAQARAVFDGQVSAVFQFQGNGLFNVLVRHGNYISVYCNLSAASVKSGDRVKTNQSIGTIFSDPSQNNRTILHFQLRREKEQMNPEPWLDR